MTDAPTSISDMISRWPTITAYAQQIGCGYEAARKMADRESIAPEHWDAVVEACLLKSIPGVTLQWLAAQRKKARALLVADSASAVQS